MKTCMTLTKEEIETAIEALNENIDLLYSVPIRGTLTNKVNRFLVENVVKLYAYYPFSGLLGFFVSHEKVKNKFGYPLKYFLPSKAYIQYLKYVENDGRSLKCDDLSDKIIADIEAYSDTRKEVCRVFISVLQKELEKVNES